MKEKKEKWSPDVRKAALAGIGFLLGRVWLFGTNPFAVAYFAGICGEGISARLIAAAVLLGMFTESDGLGLLKYIVLFSLVIFADSWQKRAERENLSPLFFAVLCGGLNFLLGAALSLLSVNTWEMFAVSALEGVAVFALANVYRWGLRFFLCGEWRRFPGNEELISILAIAVTALCAVPRPLEDVFSVVGTLRSLLVLFMAYRYGAATGTMAGAAGGILLVVTGGDPVMVGVCCLLGVSVGMFRKIGRIGSSIAFFLIGLGLIYFLQGQEAGIVELRAMVSAIVIFLALPKSVARPVEEDEKEQRENLFAREDVRALANDKIGDFADAFKRLSRSFSEGGPKSFEVSPEEIEEIYEELSEKVCRDCANCKFCWDKHLEETRDNFYSIIYQAFEDESAAAVSPEFGRRCIRLNDCLEHALERIAVAKMNLGWRNRMAENREVMARQMMEVSDALRSFTLELYEPGELPDNERKKIIAELKKEGIRIRQISMKRRRGRLEIVFVGSCRGRHCLTKTDIAKALSRGAGVRMCPGRETRNVLADAEVRMFFQEDTKYKALTGFARVAKAGENVSGDNYSFMELSSGELFMILADGMGSGEVAYRDSGGFLEVLGCLMEAGFEKKSALRMLNTLFVMNFDGRTFTTLDMVSLDLHTGVCEFIKSGAAATFIKRGMRVDTICSEALPVGVDMEAESDVAMTRLEEGDMVIMVSDGVIDGFDRAHANIEHLIENMACQNPNDVANQILMNALAGSAREAADDMSVLAAGLWLKNPAGN